MKAAIQIKLIIIISIMIIITVALQQWISIAVSFSVAHWDLGTWKTGSFCRCFSMESAVCGLKMTGEPLVSVLSSRSSEIPGASAPGAEQMVEMVYLSSTKEPRSYRGRRPGFSAVSLPWHKDTRAPRRWCLNRISTLWLFHFDSFSLRFRRANVTGLQGTAQPRLCRGLRPERG